MQAVAASLRDLRRRRAEAAAQRRALMAAVNERRSRQAPLFGRDLVEAVRVELPVHQVHVIKQQVRCRFYAEFCVLLWACDSEHISRCMGRFWRS